MKHIIIGLVLMFGFAGVASAQQKAPAPKMPSQPVNTAPGCPYEGGNLYYQYFFRMTQVSLEDPCGDDFYGSGSFVEYPGENEPDDNWQDYWDYDRPLPD